MKPSLSAAPVLQIALTNNGFLSPTNDSLPLSAAITGVQLISSGCTKLNNRRNCKKTSTIAACTHKVPITLVVATVPTAITPQSSKLFSSTPSHDLPSPYPLPVQP